MKLLTTKQLVRIGRVRCCDLADVEISDTIYPPPQPINKDTLARERRIMIRKYYQEKIIKPIQNGELPANIVEPDLSVFNDLSSLFAHYPYDIDIHDWVFEDETDCSYMFAFSEFDQWGHLPEELRDELINPQRKIDTTSIFYGCKGEKKFYQEIEEERKKRNITLLN